MTAFEPARIKRNDHKVRCTSQTESGEACRAWAIHGSDPPVCATHAKLTGGGAPKGNRNALRHSTLGYVNPAAYESAYYQRQRQVALTVCA